MCRENSQLTTDLFLVKGELEEAKKKLAQYQGREAGAESAQR